MQRLRSSSSVSDIGFGEAEMDRFPVVPEDSQVTELEEAKPLKAVRAKRRMSLHKKLWITLWSSPLVTCVTYSVFSIAMTLVNKLILTTYHFNYHMVLLFYQNITCVTLLQLARYFDLAEFESIEFNKLVTWIPLNVLFTLMLLTGFYSLNLLSVPMATIFKNSTNVLITFGDWMFYGQSVDKGTIGSLAIILLGAVFAGASDLEYDPSGYFWAIINCLITAGYVLYMPRAISDSKLNAFGRVYYNNLLSLPMLVLVDVTIYHDFAKVLSPDPNETQFKNDFEFVIAVVFSGCIGFFLSLTSFQCVQSTSPTTYSMVGAMNKIPLAIFGILLFKTNLNLQSSMFISLSLAAGILYAYTKARQRK